MAVMICAQLSPSSNKSTRASLCFRPKFPVIAIIALALALCWLSAGEAKAFISVPSPDIRPVQHYEPQYYVRISNGFEVADIVGRAGVALRFNIRLPNESKENFKFLMFRRLPENFRLSAGFGTRSYWVLSLDDVPGLFVITPADARGTFEMEVLLFRGERAEPERRQMKIVLQAPLAEAVARSNTFPPSVPQVITRSAAPPPRVLGDAGKDLPGEGRVKGVEMTLEDRSKLLRGNKLFEEGNVTLARLFFQHLAKKGISAGALALAQTYDSRFLNEIGVQGGVAADPAEARKWYDLAGDLALAPPESLSATP